MLRRRLRRARHLLYSLRGRFLVIAVAATLVLLAWVGIAFGYLGDALRTVSGQIALRQVVEQDSDRLRTALRGIERDLTRYLLTPDPALVRQSSRRLRRIHEVLARMDQHPWIAQHGEQAGIRRMQNLAMGLDQATQALAAMRMGSGGVFAHVPMLTEVMEPASQRFDTACVLAQNALDSPLPTPAQSRLAERLLSLRLAWSKLIAAFRIYLATQSGVFGQTAPRLAELGRNVELYYSGVETALANLRAAAAGQDIPLALETALTDLPEIADIWRTAFESMRRMLPHDWRQDLPVLQSQVMPLLDELHAGLLRLAAAAEQANTDDINLLRAQALRFGFALWAIAALLIGLIVLGYLYVDRRLLRPVAEVTWALRNGQREPELTRSARRLPEARYLVEAYRHMRAQVEAREATLAHHALHDALTGLNNRLCLHDRLAQAVREAARDSASAALLVLDLDRFKEINDSLGHAAGDAILQQVAHRLRTLLRDSDTVARLGGDEFAVVLPRVTAQQAERVAAKVLARLRQPYALRGRALQVGASLGVALFPQHGADADGLMRRADSAMYEAKRSGAGVAVYREPQARHLAQLDLAHDLRVALEADALALYYQPILRLCDRGWLAIEALLRWPHPELGLLTAEGFVPLAEQHALIDPLCRWVVTRALADCAQWRERGLAAPVAVNLSVWNLRDAGLADFIAAALAQAGLPAESLLLEITEDAMLLDADAGLLHALHGQGVQLVVDDYGTGFSSLARLQQAPLTWLKIDRSFVTTMTEQDDDAIIVRSTIALAHHLGRQVIAAGVESQDVLDALQNLGCDAAQGFHIARPMPIGDLLARHEAAPQWPQQQDAQ